VHFVAPIFLPYSQVTPSFVHVLVDETVWAEHQYCTGKLAINTYCSTRSFIWVCS